MDPADERLDFMRSFMGHLTVDFELEDWQLRLIATIMGTPDCSHIIVSSQGATRKLHHGPNQ
jgi:hypothetical protein